MSSSVAYPLYRITEVSIAPECVSRAREYIDNCDAIPMWIRQNYIRDDEGEVRRDGRVMARLRVRVHSKDRRYPALSRHKRNDTVATPCVTHTRAPSRALRPS